MHLVVLMTSHDRRETTLRCLDRVAEQVGDHRLEVVLVDAASSDGTADAVRRKHPAVEVHDAADDVFWNAGMRQAWELALARRPDGYVWLNDDTTLDLDAVDRLVRTWEELGDRPPAVVVGSTRDPDTGRPTYGGVVRPDRRRPLRHRRVDPGEVPVRVETMNGNCVLVPAAVVDLVGLLDEGYSHGMGDFDYGHRVVAAGGEVWLAPGTVGTCARNPARVGSASLRQEWQRMRRPTDLPPQDFARFARRWAGPLWPFYWASPYVRRAARTLAAGMRR